MNAPAVAPAERTGRNGPCPFGSGRKFKQCCGAARPAAASVSPPRSARPYRLKFGPLSEAGERREAAEALRHSMHGVPTALRNAGNAAGARPATPARRQTEAAEPFRQLGVGLLRAGKLPAAITALRQATRLGPADARSHRAFGLALLRSGRLAEAIASLELAIVLEEEVAVAHYHLAVALDRQGLTEKAMAAYRRAVELMPELAGGHRRLAELLEAEGEAEDAAASYRRAAADPDTTTGRLNEINALLLDSDPRQAEALLRQAIARDPASDRLHGALGDVLAMDGRFDEAIAAFDRALDLNPLQVGAHLAAVQAKKCTAADRPRLDRMLAALDSAGIDDTHRASLHFAIGKVLDDLAEYRPAMRHFDRANEIRRRTARFDGPGLAEHVDRLVARYTPDFFAANDAFGLDDQTPLLIVGMPRSGTTLVEQIASSHPAVAAGGELRYWVKRGTPWGIAEATYLSVEAAHGLSREYLALLRRIGPQAARVTDKAPFNHIRLGLIHLLLPKARMIHCRRHPVDTSLSIYFTFFKGRMDFACAKADLAFAYRQYARLMEHWRAVLPHDRFIEVDYEQLITDRETVTRRLIASSGLDWHDACLEPERNKRTVRTASLWQARQPVYSTSVARWRRYEPWLGELRELLRQTEDER
jgi:tetratricopeptide (TPR) repeat protein